MHGERIKTQNNILPVLYTCKALFITLMLEYRLSVFESWVQRERGSNRKLVKNAEK
jgi:hypothetical protein